MGAYVEYFSVRISVKNMSGRVIWSCACVCVQSHLCSSSTFEDRQCIDLYFFYSQQVAFQYFKYFFCIYRVPVNMNISAFFVYEYTCGFVYVIHRNIYKCRVFLDYTRKIMIIEGNRFVYLNVQKFSRTIINSRFSLFYICDANCVKFNLIVQII